VKSRSFRITVASILLATGLAACGDDDDSGSATSDPADTSAAPATPVGGTEAEAAGPTDEELLAVATTYADLVDASYEAAIASATEMQTAIAAFLADPTEATLGAAKDAWLAARDDYGPTEAFRLYDGPIDAPETGPEGQINAWPLDEAYIDYVKDDPTAGIINNVTDFPEITVDALTAANEEGGEANISTGWHAIEFLLWGQDLDPTGPGARPVTDYTTAENADRRGEYLTLLAQLLIDDLNFVNDQWKPDTGTYRTDFLGDPAGAITKMFRGIGALSSGELAGERMNVAFETKDQEDEHSCFSDNTNADVRNNVAGIRMVYLAEFPGITGPSLSSLVAAVDPALDTKIKTELDTSVELASNFPATFEQMIQADSTDPANQAFLAAIESIEGQGDDLAAAAAALGISISIEV
jgi:putative iron-regulated protein